MKEITTSAFPVGFTLGTLVGSVIGGVFILHLDAIQSLVGVGGIIFAAIICHVRRRQQMPAIPVNTPMLHALTTDATGDEWPNLNE
jgi:predicted MFS family arabinose efflux permease